MIPAQIKRMALAAALAMPAAFSFAQAPAVPTRNITPDEVVQASVKLVTVYSNTLAVKWTYTEKGATNMLAFWEAHQNQSVRTVIGTFESPLASVPLRIASPDDPAYNRWKEDWLKRRTDKFITTSEDDAKKIMAGLKGEAAPAQSGK
jgi:hypothetical protein